MSTMNLLPDYYVKRRFRDRIDLVCVVLFAVIMAGIIGADKYSGKRTCEIRSENMAVNTNFNEAASFLKQDFFRLQSRAEALLAQARASASKEDRLPRSYVLAAVTKACPQNVSLSELLLASRQRNKPAPKRRGRVVKQTKSQAQAQADKSKLPPIVEVRLQGSARTDADITKYYSILKAHPLTQEVELQYTREARADGKRARRRDISALNEPAHGAGQAPAEPAREFAIRMILRSDIAPPIVQAKASDKAVTLARRSSSKGVEK